MPAPDEIIIGHVNNRGPGPVCGVCALGPVADQIVKMGRTNHYNYRQIADALNAGARYARPITDKMVWHHTHGHRGRTNG